jgi:biotin transport system substrate-specific component
MKMTKTKTTNLVLCALFAALSAVLSPIAIPVGPVPISLMHISVFAAAGLLGAKRAAASQIIFVLIGAVGIPVFSGFTGGMGILFGPTGGFIFGYIACAFITGLIIEHLGNSVTRLMLAMYVGWVVTYIWGITWYIFYAKTSLWAALPVCLLPFLPGDFLKTILSAVLVNRLYPVVNK